MICYFSKTPENISKLTAEELEAVKKFNEKMSNVDTEQDLADRYNELVSLLDKIPSEKELKRRG